jgi:phosphate transport system protein
VGDEAARIARTVQRLINTGVFSRLRLPVGRRVVRGRPGHRLAAQGAGRLCPLDTSQALEVLKQDDQIDQEFDGLMRKLITYMMEDPRTISASIDLVFVAKAIERVGDHAKNLAEPSSTSSRVRTCATPDGRRSRRDRADAKLSITMRLCWSSKTRRPSPS